MIRDPSDGSVKTDFDQEAMERNRVEIEFNRRARAMIDEEIAERTRAATRRPTSAENWGLKSLDRAPKESTFKPMTAEQLAEHYAKFKLAFEPKEQSK